LRLVTREIPGADITGEKPALEGSYIACSLSDHGLLVWEVIAMTNHESLVYRVPEVARLLGCTEAVVRQMIVRGQIPSRGLGRRVVVLPEELRAHLEALNRPDRTVGRAEP